MLALAQKVQSLVNPGVEIEFQSYAQAYDEDFEDIRRRVPDLSRIRTEIGYEPKLGIDDIIKDVHSYMLNNNEF